MKLIKQKTDGLSGGKTKVISCSTGPDSWPTYRLELSQFVNGDEGAIIITIIISATQINLCTM